MADAGIPGGVLRRSAAAPAVWATRPHWLASLRGCNALAWSQRIDHDLERFECRNLWLDVRAVAAAPLVLPTGSVVEVHDPNDPLARVNDDPVQPRATGQVPSVA